MGLPSRRTCSPPHRGTTQDRPRIDPEPIQASTPTVGTLLHTPQTQTPPDAPGSAATTDATDPAILAELADQASSPDPFTRREAASSPHAPGGLLVSLAADPVDCVRYPVADNPRTPPEALAVLTEDTDSGIRVQTLGNPSASASTLQSHAADPDSRIRHAIARNPSTTIPVLLDLRSAAGGLSE